MALRNVSQKTQTETTALFWSFTSCTALLTFLCLFFLSSVSFANTGNKSPLTEIPFVVSTVSAQPFFPQPFSSHIIGNTDMTLLQQNAANTIQTQNNPEIPDTLMKLPNGLTILVRQDNRFPLASLRLYVHAGASYETEEQAGISHVLEHMVFKGTARRPKNALAAEIETAGGYFNAATSYDYTVYYTDMPSKQWKLGLDVLVDMAFSPTLDNKELESEKDVVVAELKRRNDSPQQMLFDGLLTAVYNNSAYARPVIGFEDTIRSFTPKMIRSYIDQYYQPQSMLLVVVGDVDPQAVFKEAERLFAPHKNNQPVEQAKPINLEALPTASVTVSYESFKKMHIALAFPTPSDLHAESSTLDLLSYLLAGDNTSLFYQRYKYDKQLIDSVSVSNVTLERAGVFLMIFELDPANYEAFWQLFTQDMQTLSAKAFTAKDIQRASLNIKDSLYRSKETIAGISSKLGYFQFHGQGAISEENYIYNLESVTQASLQASIDKWITPHQRTVHALVPETDKTITAEAMENTLAKNWKSAVAQKETAQNNVTAGVEYITLGEGQTLVLIPDNTLPYASMHLAFTGGNSLLPHIFKDTASIQGITNLAAETLTTGAGKFSATAIEKYQSERAASIGASSGHQSFTISLSQPAEYNTDMLQLLSTLITDPSFKQKEIARIKKEVIASIVSQEDSPLGLVSRHLPGFLFTGGHPYAQQISGSAATLENIKQKQIKTFWAEQSKQPWVFAVCGSFDREAIIAFAKTLPAPQAKTTALAAPTWTNQKSLELPLPKREQAHLLLIFPTVGVAHEDVAGISLLENILAGQSGLLFTDLRDEKGLGYTVTAFKKQYDLTGFLAFYIGTEPDKLEVAQKGFEDIIKQLQTKPLPQKEIIRGQQQIMGDYYRQRQRLSSRAGEAASLTLLNLPENFNLELMEKAGKLTPKDIQEISKRYLQLENAKIIIVKP